MAAIVANCAISLNCELTQPVKVQYIDGNMFSMDNAGNTAHVYVFYNGEPQEIVGSVSADVIRSDGMTVAITGAMSGNRAYVIFPQSCYAVPGVVSVVIKVTEGTTVTTIAAFVANVYRSSTDTIVDPGTIIPSVQNLISAIETAVASIPADYSSLWESLAPDYTDITFPVTAGKYCTYNGTLYIAKVDIATTESFTAAHWQSTNIGDNLSALKSAFKSDDNAGFAVMDESDMPIVWAKKHYIDADTGIITYSATGTHSVTQLIRIPDGATAFINTYNPYVRYATYDEDGTTIQVYAGQFGINIEIPSTAGKYFALQYGSTTDSDLETISIHFEYADGIARESEVAKRVPDTNVNGYSNEQATATGNPVAVHDAANDDISAISVADGTEGEVLSLCGKNLFNFQHKSRLGLTSNGVTFNFNMSTQEYTVSSTNGATAIAISANNNCTGCLTLDGVTAYHNFHFRMKADTPVTITPNYNYEPYYDDKVQFVLMWIESGNLKMLPIGYEGATIIAKAGVEYGIRLKVSAGFKGTVKLKPQVEIGGESTAFEQYRGVDMTLPLSDGSNLFNMSAVSRLKYAPTNVTAYFDYIQQTVKIEANAPASNTIIYNQSYDGKVNTKDFFYLAKFTPGAVPVMVPGVPEELVGLVNLQVSDGTNYVAQNITTEPKIFIAESGKEYGFRIMVYAGAKFKYTFKPVISTGKELLKQMGSRYPVTSVYTNGSATVSVTYNKAKLSDEILSAVAIAKGVKTLTGGKIINALDKLSKVGGTVCFIDDDTTNATYVDRFHDIFADEGVVGNYAVEMENLENNPGLDTKLLEYERQGFGMLYHCYKQHGDEDRYWESGNEAYDEDLIRTNFYRGLREFKQIGFNSARYWVTPYGVDYQFIQDLAKEADMECLLTCPTSTYAANAILTLGSNVKRYNMPRCIFLSDTDNDWQIKKLVDGCASDGGLLVIVTHVNSWAAADVTANTARLTALIQYIKAAGCKIQNFMTAYQTFKPLLMLNELF